MRARVTVGTMIHGIFIINNHGKARLIKVYNKVVRAPGLRAWPGLHAVPRLARCQSVLGRCTRKADDGV